jgi:hypothetical protein
MLTSPFSRLLCRLGTLLGAMCVTTPLLAADQGVATTPDPERAESPIEARALEILIAFAEFTSKIDHLSLVAETGFDVMQDSGQKIEFGARRQISIRRPDRFRVDFENRDGTRGGVVFDGTRLTVFSPDENVYATAQPPKKKQIDEALDYIIEDLDVPVPLGDLFYAGFPGVIRDEIQAAHYVGESVVAQVPCHHIAARSEEVDFQIWIAREGDPLPRRLVITYRHARGEPQFWAQFLEWNLAAETPDALFAFDPPPGARQIRFMPRMPHEPDAGATTEGENR